VTEPPCISVRLRTIDSPSPSPPSAGVARARPLHEQVEDRRQQRRRDPHPVVAHPHHREVALARCAHRDGAAARRVLGRVGEQVRHHLRQPRRVGLHQQADRRHVHLQAVLPRLE
jgi:hypothetical protein